MGSPAAAAGDAGEIHHAKEAAPAEPASVPDRASETALARRLGGFPVWHGQGDIQEARDRASARFARAGIEILARMG